MADLVIIFHSEFFYKVLYQHGIISHLASQLLWAYLPVSTWLLHKYLKNSWPLPSIVCIHFLVNKIPSVNRFSTPRGHFAAFLDEFLRSNLMCVFTTSMYRYLSFVMGI